MMQYMGSFGIGILGLNAVVLGLYFTIGPGKEKKLAYAPPCSPAHPALTGTLQGRIVGVLGVFVPLRCLSRPLQSSLGHPEVVCPAGSQKRRVIPSRL